MLSWAGGVGVGQAFFSLPGFIFLLVLFECLGLGFFLSPFPSWFWFGFFFAACFFPLSPAFVLFGFIFFPLLLLGVFLLR